MFETENACCVRSVFILGFQPGADGETKVRPQEPQDQALTPKSGKTEGHWAEAPAPPVTGFHSF